MADRSDERASIISAAYRCLDITGGTSLAVTDILHTAGLSTRAFYRHFKTKDELLLEMFRRDREIVIAELQAAVTSANHPADALRRWIDVLFELVSDQRKRRRVNTFFSEEMSRARGYLQEVERFAAAEHAALAQIFYEGQADGTFPHTRPDVDSRFARAAIEAALLDQIHQTSSAGPREAASQVLDFIFRSVGADDAATADVPHERHHS
ncbi:MAG: regulatory protein TetR [Aeromicrobium sp.]|nr:regulatory protein TetR [Aeromicrobium sp.]